MTSRLRKYGCRKKSKNIMSNEGFLFLVKHCNVKQMQSFIVLPSYCAFGCLRCLTTIPAPHTPREPPQDRLRKVNANTRILDDKYS